MAKPLLNSVRILPLLDRYTTKNYCEDGTYYFEHTNGLVLMGLSELLIKKNGKVINIEYLFKKLPENLDSLVKGKKKSGGISLGLSMKLLKITFEGG